MIHHDLEEHQQKRWTRRREDAYVVNERTFQYLRLVVIKKKATSALRSSAVRLSRITTLRVCCTCKYVKHIFNAAITVKCECNWLSCGFPIIVAAS
ncbi:hypothetical protein T12_4040 [Trichinella patagoniensis]|uniref:Uncharacterized protein n=1 Tax=Trichinella patagoniensis TaxID=990121 RepID=A0A0V0ZNR5_9BILA|nr:hypothetical protein T12_4040 [Trichinella patagoniensis]